MTKKEIRRLFNRYPGLGLQGALVLLDQAEKALDGTDWRRALKWRLRITRCRRADDFSKEGA